MASSFTLLPPNWGHFRDELAAPFGSLEQVREFLSLASSGNDAATSFKGLDSLQVPNLLDIFNFVRVQALRIEAVFPSMSVPVLRHGTETTEVSLSREQVLVLLSHMTLLTLKTAPWHLYWITFENWLTDGRPCAMAYLNGLMAYFSVVMDGLLGNCEWKRETVSFRRNTHSVQLFPLPKAVLERADLHLSGSIGDFSDTIVDFANQDIGFGIGGTQEEILFASFIELCPAMIFCDTLHHDEAIIACNVIKYASYRGYGFSVCFDESKLFSFNDCKGFNVIAMDAMDFSASYEDSFSLQIQRCNLERELGKLVAGYSCFHDITIDTGNWGCGAFGGNKYIKATLQMIAATITGNRLSFCCFSDDVFFQAFSSFLERLPLSVDYLWDSLLSIDPNSTDYTFESAYISNS
jgi:poly(ADP-ribose) glycohydrolase